jgi:trypsin
MGSKRFMARAAVLLAAVPVFAMSAAVPTASAQTRIVGGTEVPDGKYSFMTSLRSRFGSHFCGGTLIHSNWVLTASHCVAGKNAKSISVVVGRTTLSGTGGYASKVTRILMHPQYGKPVQYAHDAALLQLTTPVTAITPIAVNSDASPTNPYEAEGYNLTTTGWGTTSEGAGCCPDRMREVDVPVVSDANCGLAYGSSLDPTTMLCAGMFGKDSCQGDSGGPLFANVSPPTQLGTVSWGNGCARKEYPGVYGELNDPSMRDWIRTNAGV